MIRGIYRSFVTQEWLVHIDKESSRWYRIQANIVFMTEQFRQFQTTVIEETIWQIQELLENDDVMFDDIVRSFENLLQDTNEKLMMFADKMTAVSEFDIRWIIMISQHTNFVSTVIGDTSLVLLRKWHVAYTMQNDDDTRQKISLFGDIIEWDLHRDEDLLFFGCHIDTIMERDDMEHILQQDPQAKSDTLLQNWIDDIETRIAISDVGMIAMYSADMSESRGANVAWFSVPMPEWVRNIWSRVQQVWVVTLQRLKDKIRHRQFIIILILVWVFLLFVVWSLVSWFIKNYSSASINPDGTVTSTLSIEDIKKEIVSFQKLDPISEEKAVKYNAILAELNRLEQEGRRINDVKELKKILNTEYLQWFNIIMLDNLDEQMMYQISSLEASTIQRPISLHYNKWLYIGWSQGVILAWISSDIKGTAVRNSSSNAFKTCTLNLLRNGMYCATESNALFHLAKAGAEAMWGENVIFPWSIMGLSTFGSSNFYVLANDPAYAKDATYVVRYTNVLWSQNLFGSMQPLPLVINESTGQYPQWFSSISIDGTFLLWSKDEKKLIQLFRNPQDKALSSREVPLKWGTNIWWWFSEDVKVMTSVGSRYVYLYDRKNHTLTTYTSAPAKTNDAYTSSYGLEYVMRLDFSALDVFPVDITVDESDGKQAAYILIPTWVAKIAMSDLLETLNKSRLWQQKAN